MSDARALAQLDELLDLDATSRAAWLEKLAAEDPAMHSRLLRLWNAAVANDGSQVLQAPARESMRSAQFEPAMKSGQVFANYRLLEEIGRGGMAVVWRAERADGVVKRAIALKLPLFLSRSAGDLMRFAREKDALAALSHPNIAQLHDAGVSPTGQPFIALELVDGLPITDYCDSKRLGIDARLTLFLDVLAAVEHAHRHLIVHRDLKPSNILVDGEGRVKLLDFGIAKLLDDAADAGSVAALTEHGNVALTPRYAAPEQVSGKPISTLTDIFVLGVLLHQLLTGKLPYAHAVGDSPSLVAMVTALNRGESSRPSAAQLTDVAARARGLPTARRLSAALQGDLDTIVKKALSVEPAMRYGSAGHFADDIESLIARRPIAARPASVWYAGKLLLRRHRNASIVAGAGLIAVFAMAAVAWRNHLESRMYEERSVAVQDFMRDLVNDAEPDEGKPDAPVPFVDMIDGAVERARADFKTRPALQGELLSELGRMYWLLGRTDESLPILNESLTLLERSAPDDDPALNKARTYLAAKLIERNEVEKARALASKANLSCTRDNKDCARARANALTILGQIAFIEGHAQDGMTITRQALNETIRAFGKHHVQTVLRLHDLAMGARNTGRLDEANAMMTDALDIASNITLKQVDRTGLLRTQAILDIDLGRYEAARNRLTDLLTKNPNRDERALQLRLLANALLGLGESRQAFEAANHAVALELTTQIDVEGMFARQARSLALAQLGDTAAALSDIDAVRMGLLAAEYAVGSFEILRARRIRAEILLRGGRVEEATRELASLLTQHQHRAEPLRLEWGLALDLMGCAQRERAQLTEARQSHALALDQLKQQLPGDHPFLRRNTLYMKAAAESQVEFVQLARTYGDGLPSASLWRRMIEARLEGKACGDADHELCAFVL
jgi:eukaryotic-like serine/threonine-protein kinase